MKRASLTPPNMGGELKGGEEKVRSRVFLPKKPPASTCLRARAQKQLLIQIYFMWTLVVNKSSHKNKSDKELLFYIYI
jgi:hypothetical protein